MENSTKTRVSAKNKAGQENESLMKHVIELSERIDYILDALKSQANVVQEHQGLLERVRSRMGL